MPRARTQEQREQRDALIIRLFLMGNSSRDIARHPQIDVSFVQVAKIIRNYMSQSAEHIKLLSDEALHMHVARQELLLRAMMPKALDPQNPQQIKAWEGCRRLLEQQARLYGLDEMAGMVPEPPEVGVDDEDESQMPVTKLEEYRRRHR